MANKIFNIRVKNKRDTEANWKSKNPVLLDGEIIIVTTTSGDTRFKVGDGKKTYNQLPFQDQKTRDLIPSVDSSLSSTSTNPVQNKIIKSELDKKAERDVVNTTTNGLMSVADKKKLDGIAAGANKITVDTSLSSTSTNPVQNKIINSALSGKAGTSVATTGANGLMSAADKKKLDGIAEGANKTDVDSSLSSESIRPVQNRVVKSELDNKLDKSGGTLTGNLTGKYIAGTWLQTTEATGYLPTAGGTMTGAVTTKGIKLTSGTDFGSSLPSSLQSNQLFFQTLGTNYILDNVYPVGSIYMSVNSTNPKNLFGGTWEQIQGKFLFGMNSNYPAGSTGGEITQAEMPKHNHIIYTPNAGGPDVGAAIGFPEVGSTNTWWAAACMTGQTGDNEAHNNMPPYLSVYIWKRTK
mgnify:CR=1 FL=1